MRLSRIIRQGLPVVVILLVLAAITIHEPFYSTAQAQSCTEASQLQRETYPSRIGQRMYYTVYLPPCYSQVDREYPVLYLMHGSNENDEHWLRLGLRETLDAAISTGDLPPMVVVMPFGNVIANRNRFDELSWGRIFVEELMPHAEANYRLATEADRRAIGGVSRGGFWAYQIAFREPDLFRAVGGHSAFFDRYHAPPDYNPLDLATTQTGLDSMRLWLDYGIDDFAAPGLELMHARLVDRQLDHIYRVYPEGQHNNDYWSTHLRDYLAFYAAAWQPEPQSPPAPSGFATNTPVAKIATPPAEAAPDDPATDPTDVFSGDTDTAYILFPVVAFPAFQTTLPHTRLDAVKAGQYDELLILQTAVYDELRAGGVPLHPDTRVVPEIEAALWQERTAYTLLPISALTPRLRLLWVDDLPVVDQLQNYPFKLDSLPANMDLSRLTRLTLSGVTALARNTRVALNENGVEWASSGIADYVRRSDYFHTSNEVSFVAACPQSSDGNLLGGSSSFCTVPAHGELFRLLDVDIIELTGNHNNDYGYEPYYQTLDWYNQQGIQTVGGGRTVSDARAPVRLRHAGNDIALLACNAVGPYYALVNESPDALGGVRPGAAACDWSWLESSIPQLAQEVDTLVVTIQYEEVEEYTPLDAQRRDFRRIANLGADIVMGTAAHKPQTYEFYTTENGEQAFIHYGMGNLFFDQPFWGNRRFFMNTIYVYNEQVYTIELYPGIIDDLARPRLMTPDERLNFLFFMFTEQNGF